MLTQPMVQKIKRIYDESIIYLSQISFQINQKHYETDNVTMIIITCVYSGSKKYNKSNSVIINERVQREMSKYICSKSICCVILTKVPSAVI